jgi:hypothetical protein
MPDAIIIPFEVPLPQTLPTIADSSESGHLFQSKADTYSN